MTEDHCSFLCLKGISKTYREGEKDRVVLRDVSLDIVQGESIAILGKSGSGKSTLLNLISGIDEVDHGKVFVNGIDLTSMSDHERTLFRRYQTGFIFQFFNLIPTLTVWENVVLPLELANKKSEYLTKKVADILSKVGLLDRKDTYPDRLSGGEQQRVAIARALVHDPILVLADEPTGNLDEETGRIVLELLDSLTRRVGKNLIMVTHNQEAASYADRIFGLFNGELNPIR